LIDAYFRETKDKHVAKMNKIIPDRSTCEDIVQDAFLKAHVYKDTYDNNRPIGPWFNKILFNTLRDYQRDYKRGLDIADFDIDLCVEDKEYEFNINTKNLVEENIDLVVNRKHRRILRLFYSLGYPVKDISENEDVSVSNVTTICNRFKLHLEEN